MSEYLDTSVMVKWFRKEEDFHDNALVILDRIRSMESIYVTSSLTLLELTRALIKAGESEERIRYASDMLKEFFEIRAIERAGMDNVVNMAMEIEIDLLLNSCDAIHVASAIINGCETIWSEDRHHTKEKTKEYLKKFNIDVKTLKDL